MPPTNLPPAIKGSFTKDFGMASSVVPPNFRQLFSASRLTTQALPPPLAERRIFNLIFSTDNISSATRLSLRYTYLAIAFSIFSSNTIIPKSLTLSTSRSRLPTRSIVLMRSSPSVSICPILLMICNSVACCSVSSSKRCASAKSCAFCTAITACRERLVRNSNSASKKSLPLPVRQTAIKPLRSSLASNGTAIRCSMGKSSVSAICTARGSVFVSLTISPAFCKAILPKIPSRKLMVSFLNSSAISPTTAMARNVLPSPSGKNKALVSALSSSFACLTILPKTVSASRLAEMSRPTSTSADISRARRCVSRYRRALSMAIAVWRATLIRKSRSGCAKGMAGA